MFISNKKPKKRKSKSLFIGSQRSFKTVRLDKPVVPISERIKAYEAKTGNKLISE